MLLGDILVKFFAVRYGKRYRIDLAQLRTDDNTKRV